MNFNNFQFKILLIFEKLTKNWFYGENNLIVYQINFNEELKNYVFIFIGKIFPYLHHSSLKTPNILYKIKKPNYSYYYDYSDNTRGSI